MQIRKGCQTYDMPRDFQMAGHVSVKDKSIWYAIQQIKSYEDFPPSSQKERPEYFKELYRNGKLCLAFYPIPKKQHLVRVIYRPMPKEI